MNSHDNPIDTEEHKTAETFINDFLRKLSSGEIASFSIAYVGFHEGQHGVLAGGYAEHERLVDKMRESLGEVEKKVNKRKH